MKLIVRWVKKLMAFLRGDSQEKPKPKKEKPMPSGKGTYGSKRGRPPKKGTKKPK